jgi:predicted metal-dependent phosphotriesterase family hydrolase
MTLAETARDPVDVVDLGRVATGLHTFDELPQQYLSRGPGLLWDVPEPLVEDLTRDIVEGIAGTGIRASLLKCCIEAKGLTPGVERIATAVAAVHRETGVSISVHTDAFTRSGLLAVEFFTQHGVQPEQIMISHAGDSTDLDYLMRLADTGALLGMDRFGLDLFLPHTERYRPCSCSWRTITSVRAVPRLVLLLGLPRLRPGNATAAIYPQPEPLLCSG